MKLSFLTYLFCRYPLEYSFRMAGEYGCEGVEIWGARPQAYALDLDGEALSRIRDLKKRYGVEISMYTPELLAYPYNLASPDAGEREETVRYLLKSLEAAAGMETKSMLVTVGHPGYGRDMGLVWSGVAAEMKRICERAERLGVEVVLESLSPSEGNVVTTADDTTRMIREVGSPALKGMVDLVPPLIANEPAVEYLDRMGENMTYVHLCNSDGQTEFHSRLSQGVLPMEEAVRLLLRHGYDGWYSIELLNPYFKDPELYLAESLRIVREAAREWKLSAGKEGEHEKV